VRNRALIRLAKCPGTASRKCSSLDLDRRASRPRGDEWNVLLTSSTAMVLFLRREALCSTSSVKAPARRNAFVVSYRAPGSAAGLPEYLTMSPASVLTVMTRSSASLCTVGVGWCRSSFSGSPSRTNRYHTAKCVRLAQAASTDPARRLSGAMPALQIRKLERNRWHTRTNSRH
jgi:hypothetical protein